MCLFIKYVVCPVDFLESLCIVYLLPQSAFESKDAYYKTIGFRENEGKIENVDDYLKRIESYMKLYGALVQVRHLIFRM